MTTTRFGKQLVVQRQGSTCLRCLMADHRLCEGLTTAPCACEVCGKPGPPRAKLERPKTRATRTQDPRINPAPRKPGPKPLSPEEEELIVTMVTAIATSVLQDASET